MSEDGASFTADDHKEPMRTWADVVDGPMKRSQCSLQTATTSGSARCL